MSRCLLFITLILSAMVAWLLVTDASRARELDSNGVQFQRLVGGLGFGPATDWSRCGHSFDERLVDRCVCDEGPLLGRSYFCPHRAGAVFAPLRLEARASDGGDADVR